MCAFIESISVSARGRTAAGDVDFCKLISPVHGFYETAYKEFTEKRNGRKVNLRKYKKLSELVCFRVQLERKFVTLDPNRPIAPPMVVKLPDSCLEVGVRFGSWSSGVTCCPNCRHELRVTVDCGKHSAPNTPPCIIQPTYLPQTYLAPPSPILPSPYSEELKRLTDTLQALRLSGWYYGNLDWQGARNLLKEASIGAFVIRDSGDSKFIFSLSVQTERGPTSVRLHYEMGFFRLDCDRPLARYMPRFRCVVELVQHYRRVGQAGTVWVDREGCPHSPVLLKTPLRKSPPSLLHCARLAVHKALDSNPLTPKLWSAPKHRLLPLPSRLIDYLGEYPYSV